MRLDAFLKITRLIPQRSHARDLAKAGAIKINGAAGKPSSEVRVSDNIEISRYNLVKTVEILKVPTSKNVSKKDASDLIKLVSEELIEDDLLSFEPPEIA